MPSPADIKAIFLAAADKQPAERAAYLSEACVGDSELRRRIEALLKAHDDTGGWLGEPATPTSDYPGFAAPSVEELAPLFPQLEILELLGRGGMGAVYKARQKNLDRLVALKILPHDSGDAGFADRFTREARTLAKLNHPGIVAVHDFGTANGLYWFVMEFVDGVNLRQAKKAGTLTPAAALAIVPKICEALQFAHDAGVVHRDIKPENVLLDAKGRIKIADFGLAKLIDRERSLLTGTHQAMGTPHYMAPEQWERPLEVDHRADIYSLGVVFYELLTGELPLGRFAPPSQKVQIDVRLDEVVLRTLEKEPDRRYQHASEVKSEVERINAKVSESKPPLSGPVTARIARVSRDFASGARLDSLTTWAIILCLLGIANGFWPWLVEVAPVNSSAAARVNLNPMAIADWDRLSLGPIIVFVFGIWPLTALLLSSSSRTRLFVYAATILVSAAGMALSTTYLIKGQNLIRLAESKLLVDQVGLDSCPRLVSTAEWSRHIGKGDLNLETFKSNAVNAGHAEVISYQSFVVFKPKLQMSAGPFIGLALSSGLFVLGVIDLRRQLTHDRRPTTPAPLLAPAPAVSFLRGVVAPSAILAGMAASLAIGFSLLYQGPPGQRDDLIAVAIVLAIYGTLLLFAVLALHWFARRRQQSMLRTIGDAVGLLGLISPTNWAILICAIGFANVWLPWFTEFQSGQSYSMKSLATNMDWWEMLVVIDITFLTTGFLLFVTGRTEKLRLLRIIAILAAASLTLVVALAWVVFLPRSIKGTLAPPGVVSVGLSTALLLIGTLELRGWLASTAEQR